MQLQKKQQNNKFSIIGAYGLLCLFRLLIVVCLDDQANGAVNSTRHEHAAPRGKKYEIGIAVNRLRFVAHTLLHFCHQKRTDFTRSQTYRFLKNLLTFLIFLQTKNRGAVSDLIQLPLTFPLLCDEE